MQTKRLIFSISQLNAEVGQLLSQGLPALWVEGEISNFTRASSGHLYLSLKDAGAQVRCAMFKGRASSLKLIPKNGLKVLVRGKVGLYEPRGEYQFIIEHMEDAGVGALQRQFEELKRSLQAQGLFVPEHKQTLPAFPRCIGVITSPTGAAIRDILNVLKRRCPQIPVMVYPVLVQGEGSKEQIVNAIRQADREQRCDVLILARGGGSIEDLWSFNEEVVAHAIYACSLPIISGVGHEIDFTIADFVADVRAPTPSAAAELVSPDMNALQTHAQRLLWQLQRHQQRRFQHAHEHLQRLQQRLTNQRPTHRLRQRFQRVDELEMRLNTALNRCLQTHTQRLTHLQTRLHTQSPSRQIRQQHERVNRWQLALEQGLQQQLRKARDHLQMQAGKLHTLSPLATLERGYSIVRQNAHGTVIKETAPLRLGQSVYTQLKDGGFESIITQIQEAAPN
ncbi:exodeoxyribonuclease VII large subunit [Candidatus Thiothrix anitrata]|jgi:exodeoxyribonuclease VII large subunit|uniref:Exodeoxyribonuclease 7 large subunit n=1 Tax=Candidatus Thiothrix anitrata TaxID=2823902 RepID=A0ABX7X6R4_9GAMM|nr:exodeoxyribonuclease VII large subunit [Candidatus Thiothrix anitrata]QTR49559.1 exodeoxyribonuclease VII large subunit [Candidatus Thiothrix anitrata]